MAYKVPLSYNNQIMSFSTHATWKEAYKYAKRRRVPLFRITENEADFYLKNFWEHINTFVNNIKKNKKNKVRPWKSSIKK